MQYRVMHIPKSVYQRPKIVAKKTSITLHSTGNNAPAINERNNLARANNSRYASFHIAVDDKEAIECIPLNEISYHCGNKTGNWNSIAIEMCEYGNSEKVFRNTIQVVLKILSDFNLEVKDIVRHFGWKQRTSWRKPCPRIWQMNNWAKWAEFKSTLAVLIEGGKDMGISEDRVREIFKEELEKAYMDEKQYEWSKKAIAYVKDEGIMKGYEDGTFKPNKPVTRAEMAQIIYNINNK